MRGFIHPASSSNLSTCESQWFAHSNLATNDISFFQGSEAKSSLDVSGASAFFLGVPLTNKPGIHRLSPSQYAEPLVQTILQIQLEPLPDTTQLFSVFHPDRFLLGGFPQMINHMKARVPFVSERL